jgi:superfamily II DNA/RNA helicase
MKLFYWCQRFFWLAHTSPNNQQKNMSGGFQDLGLQPELVKATQDVGWHLPSDVQDETIPLMMGGGDVMVVCEKPM